MDVAQVSSPREEAATQQFAVSYRYSTLSFFYLDVQQVGTAPIYFLFTNASLELKLEHFECIGLCERQRIKHKLFAAFNGWPSESLKNPTGRTTFRYDPVVRTRKRSLLKPCHCFSLVPRESQKGSRTELGAKLDSQIRCPGSAQGLRDSKLPPQQPFPCLVLGRCCKVLQSNL
jgi:hypothetical protein